MSNNKNNKKAKKPDPVNPRSIMVQKVAVIVVGIILIVTVLYFAGYIPHPSISKSSQPAFTAPTSIPWGSFTEISNQNFAGSGAENIYFITWVGCPIGASISWSLNYTLSHYQGVSNIKTDGHYSDPNEKEEIASLPGLLFLDSLSYTSSITGAKVSFYPVYMYNETLFAYASNNTAISQSDLVSAGMSVVNSSVPSGIASLVYKYTNLVNISNLSPYTPSAFLSNPNHMNTVLVITGSFGTYMLNGQLYPPAYIHGISYKDLEGAQADGFSGYPYIATGAQTIESILSK
ncbi:DUF929 family protein [Oxyplasma meridianum]|uniref:DUF929 family protein n=1 Tax=Oxyplasma meridianum TaxID=3073602 RepID=A0AAX4NIE0_9ARCH